MIVGLGNPGKVYQGTRHNVGFEILDRFVKAKGLEFRKKKFGGVFVETEINGERVILLKPMEYINLSGQAVKKVLSYFKVNIEDVLIIHDDLDIDLGKYKLKANGSDGGHNGIKNIIAMLGTSEFKRFKVGIGKDKEKDTKSYVLSGFTKEQKTEMDGIMAKTLLIIDDFIIMDFEKLMNKYN